MYHRTLHSAKLHAEGEIAGEEETEIGLILRLFTLARQPASEGRRKLDVDELAHDQALSGIG